MGHLGYISDSESGISFIIKCLVWLGTYLDNWLLWSELHIASASGEDHASTGVPPQLDETKPTGVFWDAYTASYMSRAKNQHTAENPGMEATWDGMEYNNNW